MVIVHLGSNNELLNRFWGVKPIDFSTKEIKNSCFSAGTIAVTEWRTKFRRRMNEADNKQVCNTNNNH